jgi:hypothetical protein
MVLGHQTSSWYPTHGSRSSDLFMVADPWFQIFRPLRGDETMADSCLVKTKKGKLASPEDFQPDHLTIAASVVCLESLGL